MDYNPLPRITRAETQSAHITWLLHERIEAAGGSCVAASHPDRNTTPNPRLSVYCQAGGHLSCNLGRPVSLGETTWYCRCLCHYAAVR